MPAGRPSRITEKIVFEILELCELEPVSLSEAAKRLGLSHVVPNWFARGKNCEHTPSDSLTEHERLCVQLYLGFRSLKAKQESVLVRHISQIPECAETALLVRCLQPDLNFLKSV